MSDRLTKHQRCVIAAMHLISSGKTKVPLWFGPYIHDGFVTRYCIGCVVYERAMGVQLETMLALAMRGLVQYDSADIVAAVRKGRCRCGCDAWRLTEAGREFAKTLNIRIPHSEARP